MPIAIQFCQTPLSSFFSGFKMRQKDFLHYNMTVDEIVDALSMVLSLGNKNNSNSSSPHHCHSMSKVLVSEEDLYTVEEKAKVVAAAWGTELLQFLAALAI